MGYMANHFDKRLDPRLLVDGAKTVVSLLFNYYTDQKQTAGAPKLSKYAFGEDYHFVLKDKLKDLLRFVRDEIGEVNGRVFVDSAPVMDKAWAKRSGLGWMGKNTNIINKKNGSFFFVNIHKSHILKCLKEGAIFLNPLAFGQGKSPQVPQDLSLLQFF